MSSDTKYRLKGFLITLAICGVIALIAFVNFGPPSGYTIKVTDGNGGHYYTKNFAFNEGKTCIVFADENNKHRVVCGNYQMEGVDGN